MTQPTDVALAVWGERKKFWFAIFISIWQLFHRNCKSPASIFFLYVVTVEFPAANYRERRGWTNCDEELNESYTTGGDSIV